MKHFLLALLMLPAFNTSWADETQPGQWAFYPSAGLGWNQLKFVRPGGTVSANYKTINLGLTATRGNYFVSLDGDWLGKANIQSGVDLTSVEREDQTLTIGRQFNRANVFAGYTSAETKDDILGEFHYDEGLFLGTGYNFPRGSSNLSLSIAYASLDGRIYKDGTGLIDSGKTQGLSYRVGLSGPFRKDMGYKLFIRYRSYDFNSGGVVTDKDILSLGASVSF